MSLSFQFFVNGDWIEFDDFDEDWSLVHALRDRLGLTGTKVACGTGGCGSCTVLISRYDANTKKFRHYPANACITPIYSVHGCHVMTIEGLCNSEESLVHPYQDAIARGNGTQCGFCTPGMVMSMYGTQVQGKDKIEIKDIKDALQGNLCRCTGYRPILEAFNNCSGDCSSCTKSCADQGDIEDHKISQAYLQYPHLEGLRTKSFDSSRKLMEIESLLLEHSNGLNSYTDLVCFSGPKFTWLIPKTTEQLSEVMLEFPDAKLVAGCTSESIQVVPLSDEIPTVIDLTLLNELRVVTLTDSYLRIGAALTIQEMQEEISKVISTLPNEATKILRCFVKMTETYGSAQIRNIATVGGSLIGNSNGSDITSLCKGFQIPSSHLNLSDESLNNPIISSIDIPLTKKNEFTWFEKVSRRKHCDAAILNVVIRIVWESIPEISVHFGGTAISSFSAKFVVPKNADAETIILEETLMDEIYTSIAEKIEENFGTEVPFKLQYVQSLAKSLLKKFNQSLIQETQLSTPDPNETTSNQNAFKATQLFSVDSEDTVNTDLVHKAVPHASAYKHATGEAKFCDDISKFHNELELAFVLSQRAHAKITSINFKKALALDGVVGYVSHKDLSPEKNKFGLVIKDEEVFASDKVTCHGQIIAGVLANDRLTAKKAAALVEVQYEDLMPVILTNEDAIAENSYYEEYGMKLAAGDCSTVFRTAEYIVSGEVKIGSQEHFYMEPQGTIAIPKGEDKELEIISSTQNPMGVQMEVSNVLGIPANRVVVKVKRVGGGFGGKESRCMMVAVPTAIAANKFGKPVRCILDRQTDMMITGKRHPFLTRHKIAFDSEGHLQALKMSVYVNAGNSLDVSMAPIERVLINLDNAYNLQNVDFDGYVCKTNLPSNTVFRGTGAPQAAFLIENIMDEIATILKKDPVQVRQIQMYKDGDVTPYGQPLVNCAVQKCWNECLKNSKYYSQKSEIDEFNRSNKYVKKGIAITPCNFGIGYTALHMNQGAALVHVYTDGSVLISHSGVEIGQGVHSKMIQVATRELGISASKIRILETSTDKVPNSTASSASVTSDMNGMALVNACRQLIERLQPYFIANPDATWEELVSKAYFDRVSLSATGFYKVPDMGWDEKAKKGSPWNYFSTGAACSVVELDCLTGRFQILRTDIVMDVGQSLNPAIDVGQIEGAFMQGVGLFVLEDLIINDSGVLETYGPSTYKIPTIGDTPLEFNVSLLKGSSNPKAIYSSKTVGEPPLLLSTSVFFAIKDAIRSYRKSIGADEVFHMDSPATIEKILMACQKET